MYYTNNKIVISGRFFEYYNYEKSVGVGIPKLASQKAFDRPKREQREMRDDNVSRTRSKIRRLINCNPEMDRFMTLTFAENIKYLSNANPLFNDFIGRLRRRCKNIKYL